MAKSGYREIKGKRGLFGHLFLWSFIGFNILMMAWLFLGLGAATEGYQEMGAAEQAGAAIGTGVGAVMILVVWAIGDVILGIPLLLTRPSKTLVPLEN
jgi:hypothetical protein